MTNLTRHILPSLSVLFSGVLAVTLFLVFSLALLAPSPAKAERIKDIAMVEGARSNQLVGFGLVVGLSLIHI